MICHNIRAKGKVARKNSLFSATATGLHMSLPVGRLVYFDDDVPPSVIHFKNQRVLKYNCSMLTLNEEVWQTTEKRRENSKHVDQLYIRLYSFKP